MAYITYAPQYVPKSYWTEEELPDGQILWQEHINCFAVLHRFDAAGVHLGTHVHPAEGSRSSDSARRDFTLLKNMIKGLGRIEFRTIRVKLFQVQLGKITHGLIYHSEPLESGGPLQEWVMLEPNDIMFHPPWDSGEYST